jgi:predicted nuclease of predicted toxin-antitoxin system
MRICPYKSRLNSVLARMNVQTVGEEGLTGRADADIWQAAQREGRILITQDLDFSASFSPALTTE